MPRVVPSQVVSYINDAFAWAVESNAGVDHSRAALLKGLLTLFDLCQGKRLEPRPAMTENGDYVIYAHDAHFVLVELAGLQPPQHQRHGRTLPVGGLALAQDLRQFRLAGTFLGRVLCHISSL